MSAEDIILYLSYVLIPILALYIGYLIFTKAFGDMGFSSIEAIIIVFVSYLLGSGIVDRYIEFSFANIYLFTYGSWDVGINTGGAIIPLILSVYLIIKNKLPLVKLGLGILIVAVVTFFVTRPVAEKGIVSAFPYWLLPVFFASVVSIVLLWKKLGKAAPTAYVCGTMGVLLGADVFHLITLLQMDVQTTTNAVIGGASVFDMIFLTGILAVIFDGVIMYGKKTEKIR